MHRQEYLRSLLLGKDLTEAPISCRDRLWAEDHSPVPSPFDLTKSGRRLNPFCVGSDPEFCFVDARGKKIEAIQLGLRVGLAAGCDQNERLVELRPWPSVSVVEHVAGILTALRWMYRVYGPSLEGMHLRAGAFFAGDGIGGHIHFGRKRPTRTDEIAALDGVARALSQVGIFPMDEWQHRIVGDRLGQVYGKPGDFRIQRHGYEYRTLPSWLQSPAVAFICLTFAKLAVLDPEIPRSWAKEPPEKAASLLRGLAKFFRSRDDDAYILYHLLTISGDEIFKVAHSANFAPAWGLSNIEYLPLEGAYILPDSIAPDDSEIKEVQEHLMLGTPLKFRRLSPSFVTHLPHDHYQWLPLHVSTGRRSGFGDFIHNLVTHRKIRINWDYSNNDAFRVTGCLGSFWGPKDVEKVREVCGPVLVTTGGHTSWNDGQTTLTIPKPLCQTTRIKAFKHLLTETGLFPIWTVNSVKEDSAKNWLLANKKLKAKIWRSV